MGKAELTLAPSHISQFRRHVSSVSEPFHSFHHRFPSTKETFDPYKVDPSWAIEGAKPPIYAKESSPRIGLL